jgi:hypothetical protein
MPSHALCSTDALSITIPSAARNLTVGGNGVRFPLRMTPESAPAEHQSILHDCEGNGTCLRQIDENSFVKEYNCKPQKCSNYIVCGTCAPQAIFNCFGGVCRDCMIVFDRPLERKGKGECEACFSGWCRSCEAAAMLT